MTDILEEIWDSYFKNLPEGEIKETIRKYLEENQDNIKTEGNWSWIE